MVIMTQSGKRRSSDSESFKEAPNTKIIKEAIDQNICRDKICFVILLNCLRKYIMVRGTIIFSNGMKHTNAEDRLMILINE